MVSDGVSKNLSLSEYCDLLLSLGFRNVYDNQANVDLNNITDPKVSIWVDIDKGYLMELVGDSSDSSVSFANMHYELEIQRDFERYGVVRKWMREYFNCDESRLLLGSKGSTLIRHVRKDVMSGLCEYLLVLDEINASIEDIDSFSGYGDEPIKLNNSWRHLDKHPLYSVIKDNLDSSELKKIFNPSEVKKMFGISDLEKMFDISD